MILFVVPIGAQNEGGIPPGTPANGVDTSRQDDPPDVVLVAAENCRVSPGASITLEDGDGTQGTVVDGERGITITAPNGRPKIQHPGGDFVGNHATFPDRDKAFDTDGDYSVVSSTGITGCRGGGAVQAQEDTLSAGVDSDKGVIPGTATDKKMPPTGGPPFIALGALVLLTMSVVVWRGILRL
jgi:hypothetical protein